jgi:hypothetical protein
MRTVQASLPELAFVAATRGMAGAGIGLLLAGCFKTAQARKTVGWTLVALGALTTVPIAYVVLGRRARAASWVEPRR